MKLRLVLLSALLLLVLLPVLSYAANYTCADFPNYFGATIDTTETIFVTDVVNCSGSALYLYNLSDPNDQIKTLTVRGSLILDNGSTLVFGADSSKLVISGIFKLLRSSLDQTTILGSRLYYSVEAENTSSVEISNSKIQYLNGSGFIFQSSATLHNLTVLNSSGSKGIVANGVLVTLNKSNISGKPAVETKNGGSFFIANSTLFGSAIIFNGSAQFESVPSLNLTLNKSVGFVNRAATLYVALVDSAAYFKNSNISSISKSNSSYQWLFSLWLTMTNAKAVPLSLVDVVAFDQYGNVSNSSQRVFAGITNSAGQLEIPLAYQIENDTNVSFPSPYTLLFSKTGYESFNVSYVSNSEQAMSLQMNTTKGIVPVGVACVAGTRFCTPVNPITRTSNLCLEKMRGGDSCQVVFTVNATDNDVIINPLNTLINKTYSFFILANSDLSASKVAPTASQTHNVTIVS